MTTNNYKPEGIRAKRIQADNVVSGVQVQGADPQQAATLINLAEAIRQGEISADDITAGNLVSGLQYITNATQASSEELRRELAALRTKVDQAIAAQEIPDAADAEDVKDSLTAAETELTKPQPQANRVLRKLDEASTILTRSAQAAEAAGKIGALVIRLAPLAAAVWQVAQRILSG